MTYTNVFMEFYNNVKNKKVKNNIEDCYFHIIYVKENNDYYYEVADGYTIPDYVRKAICSFMKKKYNATYYLANTEIFYDGKSQGIIKY